MRHRENAGKVGIYAPTFRNSLNDPFADGTVDLKALSDASSRLDLLLLVKLHPWMHGRLKAVELPGLVFVAPDSDLYPLLPLADFLITDYSSVFFDYLLLDRPVLFYAYDLATYLAEERPMYFDYDEMTPGPKSFDMQHLVAAMSAVAKGEDDWRDGRAKVRSLVFEHQDGMAAERLLGELFPEARY
jgi:CDP-glycerol glycerophosphotransferase